MAKKPGNKMEAVRQILAAHPKVKAGELSRLAKSEHGVDISPKMAATYRYHIRSKARRKKRKEVKAEMTAVTTNKPRASDKSTGIDHLLKAAYQLGWERVKEIVDGVLHAPD